MMLLARQHKGVSSLETADRGQGLMGDPERRDLRTALSPSERSRRAAEFSRLRRDEYSGGTTPPRCPYGCC